MLFRSKTGHLNNTTLDVAISIIDGQHTPMTTADINAVWNAISAGRTDKLKTVARKLIDGASDKRKTALKALTDSVKNDILAEYDPTDPVKTAEVEDALGL